MMHPAFEQPQWLWALLAGALFGALVLTWRAALPRWRKLLLGVVRTLLWVLCVLALAHIGRRDVRVKPPSVAYLLDGSASIDEAQRQWMIRQLLALDTQLPADVPRAVVGFAREARVIRPFGGPLPTDTATWKSWWQQADLHLQRNATDLQAAVLTTAGLFPEQATKRIVLCSDGLQTTGDAGKIVQVARRLGVRIFALAPPFTPHRDLALHRFVAPELGKAGEPFDLKVVLENRSDQPMRGLLRVRQTRPVPPNPNAAVLLAQSVEVPPGLQLVTVPFTPPRAGSWQFAAEVESRDDQVPDNNRRAAAVEVLGPPRVLYVTPVRHGAPFLAQLLQAHQVQIELADLESLPQDLHRLVGYEAVVLQDIAPNRVSPAQAQALTKYVGEFGGGLIWIGGAQAGAELSQLASPLDALLPVHFEPGGPVERQVQRRLSVMLLIDRSSSMDGQKMTTTKQAAVALVKQLGPQDLLGIIAFDTQPHVVMELTPTGAARQVIVDNLIRLRPGGGTDFFPAMLLAAERLAVSGAKVNHILLMSDGMTQYPPQLVYARLMGGLRAGNITISTIAIGNAFVNTDFMQQLARETNGRFYWVHNVGELPSIVLKDTEDALGRLPFAEGVFQPQHAGPTPVLEGLMDEAFPPIRGYLVAKTKPAAAADIIVTEADRPDPLLAHWSYGLGKVAVFTSDGEARWTQPWLGWNRYAKFWTQLVRWTMRTNHPEAVHVRIERSEGEPLAMIETEAPTDPTVQLSAQLASADERTQLPLPLARWSPTRFIGRLQDVAAGVYSLSILQQKEQQLLGLQRRWISVDEALFDRSVEAPGGRPNIELLTSLAQGTDGGYAPQAADLTAGPETAVRFTGWEGWLLAAALLLFLCDVALRGRTMV